MKLKLSHFRKTVTTAGTREQLTTSEVKSPSVSIQALRANTNTVFIGNNQVSSTTHFVSLAAGGTTVLSAEAFGLAGAQIDLSQIWLDVGVNGEGVVVGYLDRQDSD
jgi:hypothetical protein